MIDTILPAHLAQFGISARSQRLGRRRDAAWMMHAAGGERRRQQHRTSPAPDLPLLRKSSRHHVSFLSCARPPLATQCDTHVGSTMVVMSLRIGTESDRAEQTIRT